MLAKGPVSEMTNSQRIVLSAKRSVGELVCQWIVRLS